MEWTGITVAGSTADAIAGCRVVWKDIAAPDHDGAKMTQGFAAPGTPGPARSVLKMNT
jgi:hypothetical protein